MAERNFWRDFQAGVIAGENGDWANLSDQEREAYLQKPDPQVPDRRQANERGEAFLNGFDAGQRRFVSEFKDPVTSASGS